jgi:hypothetical protein
MGNRVSPVLLTGTDTHLFRLESDRTPVTLGQDIEPFAPAPRPAVRMQRRMGGRTQLTNHLLELQHEHADVVVATTHVHLDHDLCLEVIFLRGRASVLREIASRLQGLKGIRKGQLVVATPGESE